MTLVYSRLYVMLLSFVMLMLWPKLYATSLNSAFNEWDRAQFSNVNKAKPKVIALAKENGQRQPIEPEKTQSTYM